MESWEISRFHKAAQKLFRANLRSVAAAALSFSPHGYLRGHRRVATSALGRERVVHGAMTPGIFVAFIIAVFSLYNPVRKFAVFYNSFQQAVGASSQLFQYLDSADDVREKPKARSLPKFSSSIRFENVGFSYDSGNAARAILSEINLEVRAGEVLALVGSSGGARARWSI